MRTVGSKWVAFATSLFVAGTAYASSDTDKELAEMRALVKELGQKVDAQQEQLQHQGGLLQDAQKVVREQQEEKGALSGIGEFWQAIDVIQSTPDLSVVLMDIMMPDMDGYETMRKIRLDPRFRTLPIVALTARAMKGDREKCLQAGASDYIAKPVNTDQLLSLLRVWLYR